MIKQKEHILYKFIAICLVALVFLPSLQKIDHIFDHSHKHEICHGELDAHLHTWDVDCVFHKFHLTSPYTIPEMGYIWVSPSENHGIVESQYNFISAYQRLHIALRGPPSNSYYLV